MATKPKTQGDAADTGPARQLGFGLLLDARSLPPRSSLAETPVVEPPELPSESAELVSTTAAEMGVDRAAEVLAAAKPRVFGVSELIRSARMMLEGRFAEVRVEGEVSGFKRSGPGHLYFTLKDEQACLECVMYSRDAARLKFQVEDGMAVRLRGRLTIYEGRGRFQMSVVDIEPTGAGALAVAFEQLKQKLQAEGLFATARKRRLPFLPRRLGVVTSPQGAVIRDIVRVAHRRFPMSILLATTPVQGPAAAAGIVLGLRRLATVERVDVIIVARGGGSMEDLWCFNDEAVARAIAACPVPVISAVGHESDFTIADFVADLRAPTPSAAAELAVPMLTELHANLAQLVHRAGRGATARLRQSRLMLERARGRLGDPRRRIGERRQRIDDVATRAHRAMSRRLAQQRAQLSAAQMSIARSHPHRRIDGQRAQLLLIGQALRRAMANLIRRRRTRFDAAGEKLHALSPRRVLERGYSLTFSEAGHVLTEIEQVTTGARVRVVLRRGEFTAVVDETRAREAGPGGVIATDHGCQDQSEDRSEDQSEDQSEDRSEDPLDDPPGARAPGTDS
jgi:exodeoxyribonuclease VII large subunit